MAENWHCRYIDHVTLHSSTEAHFDLVLIKDLLRISFVPRGICIGTFDQWNSRLPALSPARWHDKHTYLYSLGVLGTTQLNFFADHIIFNNGYMKHALTRQRMTNNYNNNKRK